MRTQVQEPACPRCATVAACQVIRAQTAREAEVGKGPRERRRPTRGHRIHHLWRHRCAQHGSRVAQCVVQRPRQTELRRAWGKLRPKFALAREVTQQTINVEQVTQAVVELAFVEEVCGAVQHHVGGCQDEHTIMPRHGNRRLAHGLRVGAHACGLGKNRMVHVDHRSAPKVLHRRNLMHPLSVVALVVRIVVVADPALHHQRRFNLRQRLLRHDDVDVGKHAPLSDRQASHHVGGALQQDQRHPAGYQGASNAFHLPADRGALPFGDDHCRQKMQASGRNRDREAPVAARLMGESTQQIGTPGLPDQQVPCLLAEPAEGGRAKQACYDEIGARHVVSGTGNSSNARTASSRSP